MRAGMAQMYNQQTEKEPGSSSDESDKEPSEPEEEEGQNDDVQGAQNEGEGESTGAGDVEMN